MHALHPNRLADLSTLARQSGLFESDELAIVDARARAALAGDGSLWLLAGEATLAGAVYAAPEVMSDRVWNILMLIVAPTAQGQGVGRALMAAVEQRLQAQASALLVETSSGPDQAAARAFYPRCGYRAVARLPDYYGAGVDKLVFHKSLSR